MKANFISGPGILDRYLAGELLTPFLLGIAGFVLIMTTDLLFTFVDMIINKGVPAWVIVRLVLYKLPAIMVLTFPVSFLFATAISLGRLSRENELSAMRTSGISFMRIAAPILAASLAVSGLALFTNEAVVPAANRVSDSIIRQLIYKQPLADIKEKIFFKDNFNRFFYVKRVHTKTNTLEDIMIYELAEGRLPRVITAKFASMSGGKWSLRDGTVHNYGRDGNIEYAATFSGMDILVEESMAQFAEQKTSDQMTSGELGSLISSLKKGGVDTSALLTDFNMKFSIPATTFVFALLAIPLSIPAQKAGRSWGFAVSVIVVFSFYVFASVFRSLGRGSMVSPMAAAWVPPLTVMLLGSLMLYRESKK